MAKRKSGNYKVVEPTRGATYARDSFTVYEYGVYPRGSVLAGQQSRSFIDEYDTVEEALKAHPDAEVSESSGYRAPSLNHLPDGPDL